MVRDFNTPESMDQKQETRKPCIRSKRGIARGARAWNDVADVLHSGEEHEKTFESEAKAGVWHGAEAPEIQIPGVVFLIEAVGTQGFFEAVEAFFALGPADQFADPGDE